MAGTMMKLTPIALALLLAGCGTIGGKVRTFDEPTITRPTLKTEVELKGIPYILPFGAKTPHDHLLLPVNPVIVVVSIVFVNVFIIATTVES